MGGTSTCAGRPFSQVSATCIGLLRPVVTFHVELELGGRPRGAGLVGLVPTIGGMREDVRPRDNMHAGAAPEPSASVDSRVGVVSGAAYLVRILSRLRGLRLAHVRSPLKWASTR